MPGPLPPPPASHRNFSGSFNPCRIPRMCAVFSPKLRTECDFCAVIRSEKSIRLGVRANEREKLTSNRDPRPTGILIRGDAGRSDLLNGRKCAGPRQTRPSQGASVTGRLRQTRSESLSPAPDPAQDVEGSEPCGMIEYLCRHDEFVWSVAS